MQSARSAGARRGGDLGGRAPQRSSRQYDGYGSRLLYGRAIIIEDGHMVLYPGKTLQDRRGLVRPGYSRASLGFSLNGYTTDGVFVVQIMNLLHFGNSMELEAA